MKKKFLFGLTFCLLVIAPYFWAGKLIGEKNTFYQSGDFFYNNGKQMLAVPNGREIEFIEVTRGDKLTKVNEVKGFKGPSRVVVKNLQGTNYAFVLEEDMIVEYDLTDLNQIKIVKKAGPFWNRYDYYFDIAPYTNNRLITAGERGISVWDANTLNFLEKIYDKKTYDLEGYNDSIYAVSEEGAVIFTAQRKKIVDSYIKVGEHQHDPFVDESGNGYFPGDDVLKKRDLREYKNFPNRSGAGNAVDGFLPSKFIYFANGWEIEKLDKNLNKVVARYNTSTASGKWASGIKTLNLAQGKRIVVFNGASILLFDENLKLLNEYYYMPSYSQIREEKTMRVNPKRGPVGTPVMISGSGFWPGEIIEFTFGNDSSKLRADNIGHILKTVKIPDVLPGNLIIHMAGKESGYEHAFNFKVE